MLAALPWGHAASVIVCFQSVPPSLGTSMLSSWERIKYLNRPGPDRLCLPGEALLQPTRQGGWVLEPFLIRLAQLVPI